jgi:hypothetical protein
VLREAGKVDGAKKKVIPFINVSLGGMGGQFGARARHHVIIQFLKMTALHCQVHMHAVDKAGCQVQGEGGYAACHRQRDIVCGAARMLKFCNQLFSQTNT